MPGFGKYLLKENWFNGVSTVQTSASEEVLGTNTYGLSMVCTGGPTGGAVVLEGSLDGANWAELASFNIGSVGAGPKLTWASDKPVKYIRLNLSTALSGGSSPLLYASVIAI